MTEFEEYKKRVSQWLGRRQELVREIVVEKNLSSVMNDTKWLELQSAVYSLPFLPSYDVKLVTDDAPPQVNFGEVPTYLGDLSSFWEEGLPPFFEIEWMKVQPRLAKYRGRLVAPEILDETGEFVAILDRLHIPYETEDGVIKIYGYV